MGQQITTTTTTTAAARQFLAIQFWSTHLRYKEYPILYKWACALNVGFGKWKSLEAQTSREQKVIADNLFLCENIYTIVKPTDVALLSDSTIFIKYNLHMIED